MARGENDTHFEHVDVGEDSRAIAQALIAVRNFQLPNLFIRKGIA